MRLIKIIWNVSLFLMIIHVIKHDFYANNYIINSLAKWFEYLVNWIIYISDLLVNWHNR